MVTHFRPSTPAPAPVLKVLELMPGDLAIGESGDQFKTLLGSCVSVILCDPRRTLATMCHIVFTGQPTLEQNANTSYGLVAMNRMFALLRSRGVNPLMCQAYVFGGGNMFPHIFSLKHVGLSNAQWVLDFLSDNSIEVVDHCLGGSGYRKVSWTVGSGEPVVETVFSEQGTQNDR
jgi:chemotaxis protein CheD